MYRTFLFFFSLGLFSLAAAPAKSVKPLRKSVSDWVLTEQTISQEALDWRADKALLKDRIAVVEARIARLQDAIATQTSSTDLVKEKRRQLLEQDAQIDAYSEVLQNFLAQAETNIRALAPQLPPPLAQELTASLQKLPDTDEATSQSSLSERMQTVTGLITRMREFDNRVSIDQSIRKLPGTERKVAVRTLWVGLGQAYYLAPDDAGYGLPSEDGWQWHAAPELSAPIKEAIQQYESTSTVPELTELPVHLQQKAH